MTPDSLNTAVTPLRDSSDETMVMTSRAESGSRARGYFC